MFGHLRELCRRSMNEKLQDLYQKSLKDSPELYVIVPGYCWRNTTRSQFKCFPALHSTWLPVAKTESSIIVWCGNIGLRLRCLYLKISQIFFEFYEMCNQIDIFCMHPLHMVEAISQLVYAKFEKSWVFGVRTLNNISKA